MELITDTLIRSFLEAGMSEDEIDQALIDVINSEIIDTTEDGEE